MCDNFVKITKSDNSVSMGDNEIIVNCKDSLEAMDCEKALDAILNKGELVISMDYMDFANQSGMIRYDFKVIKNVVIGNHCESINEWNLDDNCKYIICVVGNSSLAYVTNAMEEMLDELDKKDESRASFGFIYDENYKENVCDMYIWKEQ